MNKQIVRTLSRAVDNIVLLTMLVCLVFAIYSFWDTYQVDDAADKKKYETYKPIAEEGQKSFAELQAMNSDVIGWLTVYGTSIDYPLVKASKDNTTYLSKNAEGEWEGSGSIYVDYRNGAHFEDFNTIIIGHHMANHKMFGDLDLFVKSEFFNGHRYANLYYDGSNHGLEIFAVLTIDSRNPIITMPNVKEPDKQQEMLDSIFNQAVNKREVGISIYDHIVVMTTCNLTETNGRYTVVAKLLDHAVDDPFYKEEEVKTGDRIDLFKLVDSFAKLPIWQWIIILIALIILLWLLYKAERRRLFKKKEKRLANEKNNATPHESDSKVD